MKFSKRNSTSKFICLVFSFVLLINLVIVSNTVSFAEEESLLRIGVTEEPDSLNPFVAYERAAFEFFLLTYDSLVAFDKNLEPTASLCKDWEVSSDNLTWTFNLRDDVTWHDGEKFTAEDVKFTYEYFIESGLGLFIDMLNDIETIDIPDAYTVVIKTKEPKANMLQNITPILPKHIWKEIKIDEIESFENDQAIGTGAYKLVEWKKNEYISFKANENYFKGNPNSDGLILTVFANRDTMASSLKMGEIDVALGLYNTHAKSLENDENIEIFKFEENGFTQLTFNCSNDENSKGNKAVLDKRVRQAIELSIDKKKIIDMVYEGAGIEGTTMIPNSQEFWHYIPSDSEYRGYNPEKAKKVLADGGYIDRDGDGIRESEDGTLLSLLFLLRTDNTMEIKSGQMIMGYLKDVGIECKIETVDDGALSDKIFSTLEYDMFIWGWGGDVDPTTLLRVLATSQIGNLNDAYYSNEAFDQLLVKQSTKIDKNERQKMVFDAQKILYEDAPYIILMYGTELQAVRTDKIENIEPVSSGAVFYADTAYNYIMAKEKSAVPEIKKNSNVVGYILVTLIIVGIFLKFTKKKKIDENEW